MSRLISAGAGAKKGALSPRREQPAVKDAGPIIPVDMQQVSLMFVKFRFANEK